MPRQGGWHFDGDGLGCAPSDGAGLGSQSLVQLLESADACLQRLPLADLLPADDQVCWRRISEALANYAITSGRGRRSFWIGCDDPDAALAPW